jgi:hypothetical protein
LPDTTQAPFVSTQDLSDYLGRDVTADDAATAALDAACQICRNVADCTFDETAETIYLDGTGTDCLMLPELPVNSAGTVVVNGTTLTEDSEYVLASGGKLIRTAYTGGSADYTYFNGYNAVWPAGRHNVKVTYDHGFAGTIPSDVRRVALGLARRLLIQGESVFEALATGQQVRYQGPPMDLSATEKLVLYRYRPR